MFDTVEGYKKKIDNAKAAYRVSKHVFSVSSLVTAGLSTVTPF